MESVMEKDLFRAFCFSDVGDALDELAQLAESEPWEFENGGVHENEVDSDVPVVFRKPILHGYLRYTYRRLVEEDKVVVSADGQRIAFNTGLVSPLQEELFACGTPNRTPDSPVLWYFCGWCKGGEYDMSAFGAILPAMANYFQDPAALIFDYRKTVHPHLAHIIQGENRERFPEPFKSMHDYQLQNLLKGAIDSAVARVKRSYKTAVPQYYRGRIQLLLPLCLAHPNKADIALVVDDRGAYYRASTCLTLAMAYNNARLLVRPDRDWLLP